MSEDTCLVRWTGRRVVVTFPEHIGTCNADQVREQLLWVINRGATELIADLTRTLSCDYSGAEALARAHHRAAANGTQLRLVVTADPVRRVLSLSGLDRLVSVYPTVEAVVAAGAERPEVPGEPGITTSTPAGPGPTNPDRPAVPDPADRAELLDWVVHSIFTVGLTLRAATGLPPDITEQRIIDALGRLDDVIREIRHHVFADPGQQIQPGPPRTHPQHALERSARALDRATLLQQRVMQTAYAVQSAAADTATLLEQRAALLGEPWRIDYPTEIKRWRILADRARQMAERWDQQP
jgi:anti-sigma B factor antagonist